jgi:hypothetical protein
LASTGFVCRVQTGLNGMNAVAANHSISEHIWYNPASAIVADMKQCAVPYAECTLSCYDFQAHSLHIGL